MGKELTLAILDEAIDKIRRFDIDNEVVGFKLGEDRFSVQIYYVFKSFGDELYMPEFIELISELQSIADEMKDNDGI